MTKTICVFNRKGGVGKTTASTNLGAYLCNEGFSTLIIDLDPQGNATSGLGIDKSNLKFTMYDVLTRKCDLQDCIIKCSLLDNLSIAPVDSQISLIETEMVDKYRREYLLSMAIKDLEISYDYIILDCPPSIDLVTLNAFVSANSILIPIEAEFYSLEGLAHLVLTIDKVKKTFNPNLEIEGIIANKFDIRTRLNQEVITEVIEYFGDKVFENSIPKNIRLAESPSFGLPILLYDNQCKGADAYKKFTMEFLARQKA